MIRINPWVYIGMNLIYIILFMVFENLIPRSDMWFIPVWGIIGLMIVSLFIYIKSSDNNRQVKK